MAISNNSTGLRTGVCTSTTRPTAPYEGQHIYETDTDLTYIWGGSAWQQISGGTVVGNSGLVFVSSSTIGSGVLTHTVSSAFNSTYDNYRIVVGGGIASGLSSFTLKLGASVTGYYSVVNYATYAAVSTPLSAGDNNNSGWSFAGYMGASYQQASFDLINPNKAQWTSFNNSSWAAGSVAGMACGVHQVATAYTDFTLGTNGGVTMTGGTVTIYGYRK